MQQKIWLIIIATNKYLISAFYGSSTLLREVIWMLAIFPLLNNLNV
jgi:hypothetical protein